MQLYIDSLVIVYVYNAACPLYCRKWLGYDCSGASRIVYQTLHYMGLDEQDILLESRMCQRTILSFVE